MKNLDKEEFRVKLEEINHLVEQKDYKGAMNVVDSIDWRRVKNVRTLCDITLDKGEAGTCQIQS